MSRTRFNLHQTYHLTILLLSMSIFGCSHDPSAVALPEISMDGPADFQDQGKTWVRSEMSPADQECLARFFQLNQQLVGSPEMEGTPMLFTSGKSDRRFYWLNSTVDGSRWTCVHFDRNRFTTTDGDGNPF